MVATAGHVKDALVVELFVDGGVAKVNPSPFGGTWCWVQVTADNHAVNWKADFFPPAAFGMETVENNLSELVAAVEGLESLPDGWEGILYTDSGNTLRRVMMVGAKFGGIPISLVNRLQVCRERLGKFSAVLLGGHPTVADLNRGFRPDGKPVSEWNRFCDTQCKKLAAAHLASAGRGVGTGKGWSDSGGWRMP